MGLKVKRASGSKGSSEGISRHADDKNRREVERKRKSNAEKEKENIKKKMSESRKKSEELDDLTDDYIDHQRWTRSSRRREKEEKEVSPPRQCLGPGCVNCARNNSKYCSNECGVQLQIRRLQVILPTRSAMKSDRYHANEIM